MTSRFLDEVAEQPDVLLRMLDTLHADLPDVNTWLGAQRIQHIVLTGMGASYYAAHPAWLYLVNAGVRTTAIETAELLYDAQGLLSDDTLLVIISQSGRSVEVCRLLDQLDNKGLVLGITNDAASPLALQSACRLLLEAGHEQSVSTKTYTATLGVLHILARALARQPVEAAFAEVRSIAEQIRVMLPTWREQVAAVAQRISGVRFISFLARGVSLASARTAALIHKESARIPTEGMNSAQFRHGPIEVVEENIAAVLFTGNEHTRQLDLKLAADITRYGGHAVLVGEPSTHTGQYRVTLPQVHPYGLPIVEIIPMQLLAAQLATLRGLEVGSFRYIRKVTTEE